MKTWKKQWKAELDKAVPKLNENVLSTPVQTQPELQLATAGARATISGGKRKTITFSAIGVAAILIITLILSFALIKPIKSPTLFSIEINPSAAFNVDANGVVTSVAALNDDADILFSSETNKQRIIGKTSEEAATAFVDLAFQYGYISRSEELAAVRFSSVEKNKLKNAIAAAENYLLEKGFYACVFEQNLTEDEFANLLGVEKQAGETLNKTFEKLPELYAKRQLQDKNLELLKLEALTEISDTINDFMEFIESIKDGMQEGIEELENILSELNSFIFNYENIDEDGFYKIVENKIAAQSKMRLEQAKNDYDLPKDPKDPHDNKDFIDDKLGGGSLEDFWNGRNPRK